MFARISGVYDFMNHLLSLNRDRAWRRNVVAHLDRDAWEVLDLVDLGDFLGAEGVVFRTRTGELSVMVEQFEVVAKSLRPMPAALTRTMAASGAGAGSGRSRTAMGPSNAS